MFFWTKPYERFAALGRFTPWELCIFVLWQVLKWKTWVFFFPKSKDQCRWKPCKMFSVSGSLMSQTFHITYKGGIALPGPNKASSALGWLKQKDQKKKILRSRPGPWTSPDPFCPSWRLQWHLPFSMGTFDHHNLFKILESALQWHWPVPSALVPQHPWTWLFPVQMCPNLNLLHCGWVFPAPYLPLALRAPGFLKASLTSKEWGKEGIEYFSFFHVFCHQFSCPIPATIGSLPGIIFLHSSPVHESA